jgi:IS605 OrfB family transposase
VSQCQTSSIVDASSIVNYVTIIGRVYPVSSEDYMRLVRLARDFRRAVQVATRMIARGLEENSVLRELRRVLNKAYADSAYKVAKAMVEGCVFNGGNLLNIEVKKLFIVSEGESSRFGNRNVRLEDTYLVKVKYPYDGSWITLRAEFGEKYLLLLRELVDSAKQKKLSYAARIVFREGNIYLHLSIPIQLYLKYFKKGEARGRSIAGFDLNSDRVNLVIVDEYGRIVDARTAWFPEATSHGFPRDKAKALRLSALAMLLEYCYRHGVNIVVFENLLSVKRKRFTGNKTANRKIARFAKKQLTQYGIVMALKYGFRVLLVDPKGTTSSEEHGELVKRYGLDRHVASAYLIALRGLRCQQI